jgi:ketosteroid isomerase-like protein
MKRTFFTLITLALASFMTACGDSATGNSANKMANMAGANYNAAPPPADPEAAKAEVRKVMDAIKAGLSANNADAMDKVYADNYTFIGNDGMMMTKAERLAALRSGELKYTSFAYTEEKISVNPDGNSAVGIFKITATGTLKGKPMEGDTRTTGTFIKTKDGWRLMTAANVKIAAGAAAKPATAANTSTAANKMSEPVKRTGDPKVDSAIGDDIPPPKKK